MLPGFRFLFAAIVLSMSILVFGLGAAALLRAAHEEFASNPSWHAAPETMFAQQPEATRPVLAMLRVEPPEQKAPDNVPAVAAPAEPATIVSPAAEPERIAALKPEDSSLSEPAKPEIPVSESPAQSEATPAAADAPAAETKIAATIAPTEEVSPPAKEATALRPSKRNAERHRLPRLAGGRHRLDENRHAGRSTRRHRGAAAGQGRRRKARQEAPAGAAGGPAPQDCPARAPGAASASAAAPAVRQPVRSTGHPLIAAAKFIRPGRSRPAVRRADPIRPTSRHKARCRARRADKAPASRPARRRRSRRSSRSVSSYRRRHS